MKDKACRISYQKPLGGNYYQLGLETGYEGFIPGQFGMLQVPPGEGVILRRPFSFARQVGAITEILYKVVGRGTESLSRAKAGQELCLLGPLGKGFTVPEGNGDWVGIAGGYGVAPFLEMAAQLKKQGRALRLFYGARSAKDILYRREFSELNVALEVSTEDGSLGYRGRVTERVEQCYKTQRPQMVWSCGPMGLLKEVQRWTREANVPCELSVEETMGCGTGVCLGCVVKGARGNYLRACVEGPVFKGEEVSL